MKYWTIQTKLAWEVAQEKGFLVGDIHYIWEDFVVPYQWMMEKMKLRLTNYQDHYPVWLWLKRPDLRSSAHLERGTHGVLLEVERELRDVLVSDFDAWHRVLNDSYLALTEEENYLYKNSKTLITKEQSWERIFDYDNLKNYEYWNNGDYILQAVTGKVELDRIKYIKEFIAR